MDVPTDEELKAASAAIKALEHLIKVLGKRDLRNCENPFHELRMKVRNEAGVLCLHLVDHNIYAHVVKQD
jgi:hypothetical protein